jgi:hypothetical protein
LIPHKSFEKKPMVHSPRGETVLANVHDYMIRCIKDDGRMDIRIRCPGQCVAVLRAAKVNNARVIVFAIGTAFGEECMEIVDEDFLLMKWKEQNP